MGRILFGELLQRLVPISGLDIEEILAEQRGCRKKFGEIALALGLCQPEHVWKAWSGQTGEQLERINLGDVGIDSQALRLLPREAAVRHCAIPVRMASDTVAIAVADPVAAEGLANDLRDEGRQVKLVLADPADIEYAILTCYQIETA